MTLSANDTVAPGVRFEKIRADKNAVEQTECLDDVLFFGMGTQTKKDFTTWRVWHVVYLRNISL